MLAIFRAVLHRHQGLAVAQGLTFDSIDSELTIVAGAKHLAHLFTPNHFQVAHHRQFLDLVEKHIALGDGAGNHHAGKPGHGHFIDGGGKVLCLLDCHVARDACFPRNHAAPGDHQHQPDGGGKPKPDRSIRKAAHHFSPRPHGRIKVARKQACSPSTATVG